jgi:hypothetical protein
LQFFREKTPVWVVPGVAYNGFTLPGSHTPLQEGFCVLTPRFAAKYKVRPGEKVGLVRENRLIERDLSGEVPIPADGFLLVARGQAAAALSDPTLAGGAETVALNLPQWNYPAQSNPTADQVVPMEQSFPHILGAGPRLVENSLVRTNEVEEEFRPDVIARGPRTAIGWDKDGNWLFLVADGRQMASTGLTIPETAELFRQLGAVEAMNLDGGSSTQLVINGELINTPSGYDPVNPTRPREVMVSNALVLRPITP